MNFRTVASVRLVMICSALDVSGCFVASSAILERRVMRCIQTASSADFLCFHLITLERPSGAHRGCSTLGAFFAWHVDLMVIWHLMPECNFTRMLTTKLTDTFSRKPFFCWAPFWLSPDTWGLLQCVSTISSRSWAYLRSMGRDQSGKQCGHPSWGKGDVRFRS